SLIKYCAACNRLSKRYITRPVLSEAESEESIEVQIAKRGTLFNSEKAKLPPKEMEAAIQSSQMDVDKEEARTNPEVSNLLKKDTYGGCQSSPHSPRAEPLPSGRNRNLSVLIQTLVNRSQRKGVGKMPKPLAGGHELLFTHQELSGSGEDHRTLRRLEPIFLQRQGQKDKELVEEPKSFIHRPEEGM
ncbi:hypothetical protein O181_079290, partial [Austropuccinia psidii MF-1]|nr:hypothetical protein [Austropuccinia psidii MF-1]